MCLCTSKDVKKERIIASQIPESVLSAISTEELLDRCLEYPYLSDIFFAQNIPLMFPHIVIEFNGLTEFFTKRPDAANVLLNKFKNLDVNNAENKSTDAEKGLFAFKFYYLSLFLAQDDILKQFKGEEIKDTDELIAEGLREVESESYLPKVTTTPTPEAFRFLQNYPNPFNPVTTIRYELPKDSFVELRIYDLMGREIRTLVNGNETAGYKNVLWDGKDMFDNPVSSGMYMYKISARSLEGKLQFSQTRKMILLR